MKIFPPMLSALLMLLSSGWGYSESVSPQVLQIGHEYVMQPPTPFPHGLPETRLNASDFQPVDLFGYSVDIAGELIVAGAPGKDQGGEDAGGAYIFQRSGQGWAETARLVPASLGPGDRFGTAVAADGETLVVGAGYATTQEAGYAAGAVYVFVREGEAWREQSRLLARDGSAFDLFGSVVALDGDTLVVGTRAADDAEKGRNSGAAYVFHREGENWMEQARLAAADGGADDFFGHSVAIAGDTIAVGAFGHDDLQAGQNSGAVYLFHRQDGAWFSQSRLVSAQPEPNAQLGFSVDFASGASGPDRLAAGANQYSSEPPRPGYEGVPGRLELFQWQDPAWQPVSQWVPEIDKTMEAGMLGSSLAIDLIDRDHTVLVAGSQFSNRVYLYHDRGRGWGPALVIQPHEFQLVFGRAVALSGPLLAVGSPWATDDGAVYIYDLSGLK